MANKITKRDSFISIIEVLKGAERTDLVEVMEHEIELLDKKKASSKMTKTQVANEDIKALIIEELARLAKEKAAVQKDIDFSQGKLNNPGFIAKAPEKQVEAEKAKLAKALEKMEKIEQSIAAFSK